MGIRKVTSSRPCLILAKRVERSLLKSASGANKFISVLNRKTHPGFQHTHPFHKYLNHPAIYRTQSSSSGHEA
eukprot:1139621-Pelagomonas_calceolata.AAC.2